MEERRTISEVMRRRGISREVEEYQGGVPRAFREDKPGFVLPICSVKHRNDFGEIHGGRVP